MSRFDHRSHDMEIMDDLECNGEVVHQTLRELEIINRLLGGNNVTLSGLNLLLSGVNGKAPISIVDLGCGGGDMLMRIANWARSKHYQLGLVGIDANPNIADYAKSQVARYPEIRIEQQDVFSLDFQQRTVDVFVATLFFHHFSDEQLVNLFQWMHQQSSIGFVINDIHRNWFAYHAIHLLTRLFSKSPMVQYDAPLSVLRAFKRKELELALRKAGIAKYKLTWKWAFRWQIVVKSSKDAGSPFLA